LKIKKGDIMSFSYAADLSKPLDYVRWRLNDTEEDFAEVEDEEIQFFLDDYDSPVSRKNLNKVVLTFLKKQLYHLLISPSRERAGAFGVSNTTAQHLKLAIKEIEDEIKNSKGLASPSFGGVYQSDVKATRDNPAFTDTKFFDGRVYCPEATKGR